MLERRRMLAAAPAAIACPVSGWLSAAPSAAAPGWSLHDACPAASPVCAIPPMPPPRREVRPPPPRGPAARIAREAAGAGAIVAGFGAGGGRERALAAANRR